MAILLKDIWSIDNLTHYKIHFARINENKTQPLDAWIQDRQKWQRWQQTRPWSNAFNQQFIFSLMRFYHEEDIWLFGGVFKVLERHPYPELYKVQLTDQKKEFIGRLKIRYAHKNRVTRAKMNPYYSEFEVKEILSEPYSGKTFPGYDKIDLSFGELESLIENTRQDWKTALETIKGVYLITDTKTEKKYVGSAYGENGIWSRWVDYINTGHGGNKELRVLINKEKSVGQTDIDYCRSSFKFSLLEQCLTNMPDKKIIERETFWKDILLSRGVQGLNLN
ncbi:MAG: GIY-YIG nuclease family protein [Proteobacteria bacterium]|nr:GIY-YIG nuclease family protein [Pseudomonadota bacterium]